MAAPQRCQNKRCQAAQRHTEGTQSHSPPACLRAASSPHSPPAQKQEKGLRVLETQAGAAQHHAHKCTAATGGCPHGTSPWHPTARLQQPHGAPSSGSSAHPVGSARSSPRSSCSGSRTRRRSGTRPPCCRAPRSAPCRSRGPCRALWWERNNSVVCGVLREPCISHPQIWEHLCLLHKLPRGSGSWLVAGDSVGTPVLRVSRSEERSEERSPSCSRAGPIPHSPDHWDAAAPQRP